MTESLADGPDWHLGSESRSGLPFFSAMDMWIGSSMVFFQAEFNSVFGGILFTQVLGLYTLDWRQCACVCGGEVPTGAKKVAACAEMGGDKQKRYRRQRQHGPRVGESAEFFCTSTARSRPVLLSAATVDAACGARGATVSKVVALMHFETECFWSCPLRVFVFRSILTSLVRGRPTIFSLFSFSLSSPLLPSLSPPHPPPLLPPPPSLVNTTPAHTACTDAHNVSAYHTAQSDHISSQEHAWLKLKDLCAKNILSSTRHVSFPAAPHLTLTTSTSSLSPSSPILQSSSSTHPKLVVPRSIYTLRRFTAELRFLGSPISHKLWAQKNRARQEPWSWTSTSNTRQNYWRWLSKSKHWRYRWMWKKCVKSLSNNQSLIHSDYDSAESIAHSDFEDGQLRKTLASPLNIQEREGDFDSSPKPRVSRKPDAMVAQKREATVQRTQAHQTRRERAWCQVHLESPEFLRETRS